MQHIIQVGINVDDESVKRAVIEEVTKTMRTEVRKEIFNMSDYGYARGLNDKYEELVKKLFEDNKDEIIKRTAELLAESYSRSRKMQDGVLKAIGEKE